MSQNRDVVEQKGNQILHIRGDSDSDLEALFKAVMNPKDSQVPLQVPMRMRKLPNSFFKPPETGSKSVNHSRESSSDSTQFNSPSGLPIHHPRAHSSPASLQQTYSSNTQQHQHLRQQSYDITDDIPLPHGWEMAKTSSGQRYFLNHIDQTTTWQDPRKSVSALNLSQTSALTQQGLGPLPEGWEQATTSDAMHQQRLETQSSQQAALQQRQQKMRLQRLQMERERLRVRQEEILRQAEVLSLLGPGVINTQQELMIRRTLGEEMNISSSNDPSSTTGLDPFLGGSDYHSRQESADSGLGMGTSYSLPHTPEDFLSNMDEAIDSAEDVGRTNQQRDFPLDSMQGSNLDLGDLNPADSTANMEGEDLVPSLQEELSTDIDITDVEAVLNTNKLDNLLTWL